MAENGWGLRTRILHHGAETDPHTGAAAVPVYQVSTYAQKDPVNLGKYEYARGENPTREALEHAIAVLEGGAVVSFELPDGPSAHRFMRSVRLPLLAVSLGGVESILSYPATMSHGAMPLEERLARGITDGMVRLSVGLEDPEDLIRDLANALTS